MSTKIRANTRNILATSRHYPAILKEYNRLFQESGGKMNERKFWAEVIQPIIPEYSLASWYQFIRRFKTTAGLAAAHVAVVNRELNSSQTNTQIQETDLENSLMTNEIATSKGIQTALNLGSLYLQRLYAKFEADPDSLTPTEEKIMSEALYKGMKAQDSRIGAIGKIREDNRKQDMFEKTFDNAVYT